jgi:hypothetical protein
MFASLRRVGKHCFDPLRRHRANTFPETMEPVGDRTTGRKSSGVNAHVTPLYSHENFTSIAG